MQIFKILLICDIKCRYVCKLCKTINIEAKIHAGDKAVLWESFKKCKHVYKLKLKNASALENETKKTPS